MSSKMLNKILGIDTSTPHTVIAVGDEVVSWQSERNETETLLKNIDKLLKKLKVKPAQLKGVVVNTGPGSFTGLRVGVTVANGFGYGLNIPVVGVSEFAIIRTAHKDVDLIFLDAGRGEVFVESKGSTPQLLPLDKAIRLIKKGSQVYLDNTSLVLPLGAGLKSARTIFMPHLTRPQKMSLAIAARLPKSFKQVEPLYLRGANITKSKRLKLG